MTTAIAKLCITIAALTPVAAFAATQSVTETVRHVLADNESKNDARQICASTAKRTALEKAGSLFESDLTARKTEANGKVADDADLQMRSYAAAIVGSEVLAEHFAMENERLTVSCTVRVTFDPEEVKKKLQDIAGSSALKQKLAAQQAEMDILASQVQSLSANVKSAASSVTVTAAPAPGAIVPLPFAAPPTQQTAQARPTALPPPRDVPSRPITYIDPPTQVTAQAVAPAQTLAVYHAPQTVTVYPQTVTVYPPAPTVYYYYPANYQAAAVVAARRAYARRVAYLRWYYATHRQ